ncbi:amyloid fiber anchoring/assembly protein TapA [Rossellomorea sp. FS2]|uniref:amyloid fiber anchoring/assembly protein TapA n=1 Tax=Rossellomorea sp. FS2 TaxID=3391447 RepID=UPI003A4D3ABD
MSNKHVVIGQLCAIWFVFALICQSIQGQTGAYFNDREELQGSITAAIWEKEDDWDKSSLKFTGSSDQKVKGCPPIKISAPIMNKGETMQGTTEYEVYFALKGNPKMGQKVYEGLINPLKKNQTVYLTYMARETGVYKFRALQRPGHGNNNEDRHELWSESITIDCVKANTSEKGKAVEEKAPIIEEEQTNPPEHQTEVKLSDDETATEVKPEEKSKPDPAPQEPRPAEEAPATQSQPEPAVQSQQLDKQDTKSEDE